MKNHKNNKLSQLIKLKMINLKQIIASKIRNKIIKKYKII